MEKNSGVTRSAEQSHKKSCDTALKNMKRCPQCSRVETDNSLGFCRVDGTALISYSGSVSADAETIKFGSAPVSSEIETSVLPHTSTTPEINPPTAPTTVPPAQQPPGATQELAKPKGQKTIVTD